MSRPRRPFGSTQPGRLPSTLMKVLAAEMSEPGRLRKAKRYAADGSVRDIVIEPGIVVCEVQGSRPTPYVAQIAVTQGDGMPLRRDVRTTCSCPDDDNWEGYACKHVLASMFALADEFLIEPELLDMWRGRDPDGPVDDPPTTDGADVDGSEPSPSARRSENSGGGERASSAVRAGARRSDRATIGHRAERIEPPPATPPPPPPDPLADLLAAPEGVELPLVPQLDRVDLPLPRRRDLASVLADALAHLRLDWD